MQYNARLVTAIYYSFSSARVIPLKSAISKDVVFHDANLFGLQDGMPQNSFLFAGLVFAVDETYDRVTGKAVSLRAYERG